MIRTWSPHPTQAGNLGAMQQVGFLSHSPLPSYYKLVVRLRRLPLVLQGPSGKMTQVLAGVRRLLAPFCTELSSVGNTGICRSLRSIKKTLWVTARFVPEPEACFVA